MTCRKRRDDVETAGSRYCGTGFGGACLRTKAASGIKVARVCQRQSIGTWEPGALMLTEKLKWKNHEGESTEAVHRGGSTRSSEEVR